MPWFSMTERDMDYVVAIADVVHPRFPEDRAVLAEKLALYPEGCFVLRGGEGGAAIGYLLSHPWGENSAPLLNTLLGNLPKPDLYYIHDIALLPAARGLRAGEQAVAAVEDHARALDLDRIALVAVNGSTGFWQRHGFSIQADDDWQDKLASYGTDAVYMTKRLAM
jgi:ribosomal protein S18 acetylase RimI-like enzyme